MSVIRQPDRNRFKYTGQAFEAYLEYRRANGIWTLVHTQAPATPQGRAAAAALVRAALEAARAEGAKVRSECVFTAQYLALHPEYADLET